MNPFPVSGINFIVSVFIIVIAGIRRGLSALGILPIMKQVRAYTPRPILSVLIIASLTTILISEIALVLMRAEGVTTVAATALNALPTPVCANTNNTQQVAAPMVAFRLDDVQANWYTDTSIAMMEEAIAHEIRMVAGVIPKGLASDLTLVQFLRTHHCDIEVGIHGWDHQPFEADGTAYGEFTFLTEEEAADLLTRAHNTITRYTEQTPVSFIPPHNQMSPGTRKAADKLGLIVTSANRGGYFDVDATQWDYTNDQFVPATEVVSQCEARFAAGDDLCVIMLHPQDLLTENGELDETRWREYRKLVTYFSHERFVPTTFREIVE